MVLILIINMAQQVLMVLLKIINKVKNKLVLIAILMIFMLFLVMVIKSHFFYSYKELLKTDDINIEIRKIGNFKGALILNDSIALFENCNRIFPKGHKHYEINYYRHIEDVNKPYRLIKEENSDTLLVIKSNDTLYYKLVPFGSFLKIQIMLLTQKNYILLWDMNLSM